MSIVESVTYTCNYSDTDLFMKFSISLPLSCLLSLLIPFSLLSLSLKFDNKSGGVVDTLRFTTRPGTDCHEGRRRRPAICGLSTAA